MYSSRFPESFMAEVPGTMPSGRKDSQMIARRVVVNRYVGLGRGHRYRRRPLSHALARAALIVALISVGALIFALALMGYLESVR